MTGARDDGEMNVRPSQLTGIFGPGSIYDNLKDSMLVLGTDYWDQCKFDKIREPHLLAHIRAGSRYLDRMRYFVSVSSPSKEPRIPVASFPSWGVCPECNMLQRRRGDKGDFWCASAECRQNTGRTPQTIPVRFMSACEHGHMDDFPFYEWVHGRTGTAACTKADALLYLEDREAASPSLDSKFVSCRRCGLERNMGMALAKSGIRKIVGIRCRGFSPWLGSRGCEKCDADPVGMLKGASNVYFPVTKSAITIPPFSDGLAREVMNNLDKLGKLSALPNFEQVLELLFDVRTGYNPEGRYSVGQVLETYHRVSGEPSDAGRDIFELEFAQLNAGQPVNEEEFSMRPAPRPDRFGAYVDQVVQVEKLRQIVSITGFTRIHPPGEGSKIAPISSKQPEWLPAAENRGEGIFMSLNQERLRRWEEMPAASGRTGKIVGNAGSPEFHTPDGRAVDARYILLHTLSHMLIRSLSDLAGYSASGMQERIYSSGNMAGILIFTASPSSDGTLGGLVEQGGSNFDQILQRAVERSRYCSSDPLCSSRRPGGTAGNGAACHTCTLLPEPACESMNRFLDRAAVHSTLSVDAGGFFSV